MNSRQGKIKSDLKQAIVNSQLIVLSVDPLFAVAELVSEITDYLASSGYTASCHNLSSINDKAVVYEGAAVILIAPNLEIPKLIEHLSEEFCTAETIPNQGREWVVARVHVLEENKLASEYFSSTHREVIDEIPISIEAYCSKLNSADISLSSIRGYDEWKVISMPDFSGDEEL